MFTFSDYQLPYLELNHNNVNHLLPTSNDNFIPSSSLSSVSTVVEDDTVLKRPNQTTSKEQQQNKNKKRFQCDQCEKSFERQSDCKKHKLVHTNTRAHQCLQCFKSFKTRNNLNRHVLTHTGNMDHPQESQFESGDVYNPDDAAAFLENVTEKTYSVNNVEGQSKNNNTTDFCLNSY